jgi:hypothetical protein
MFSQILESTMRWTHLRLASLTLTLGRARSSLRRELCSVNLLNLSSAIDCLCGRAGTAMVGMWERMKRKDVERIV